MALHVCLVSQELTLMEQSPSNIAVAVPKGKIRKMLGRELGAGVGNYMFHLPRK